MLSSRSWKFNSVSGAIADVNEIISSFFMPCLVIGQWQHVRSLYKCEVVIQSGSNLTSCNNVYLFYSFVLTSRFQYYPSGCSRNFPQPSLVFYM
jgi:hypothetical protein